MITKGELRPVLKQFLPTSTVRNALGLIRRICMLILGSKGLNTIDVYNIHVRWIIISNSMALRLISD